MLQTHRLPTNRLFSASALVLSCLLNPVLATAQLSTWWMDQIPAVLMVTPAGNGDTLAAIGSPLHVTYVDAIGSPVASIPVDQMHAALSTNVGGRMCVELQADGPTDSGGNTTYSGTFAGGGWSEDGIYFWAAPFLTVVLELGTVPIHFNSPDIDGDGQVNLVDVGIFAQDYVGAYQFRSDFVYDGAIDLPDLGRFAQHLGESCP